MKKKMKMKKLWIGLGVVLIALFLVSGIKAATSRVIIRIGKCDDKATTRNVTFVLAKNVGVTVGNDTKVYTLNKTGTLRLTTNSRYYWSTIPTDMYSPTSGSFFLKSCVSPIGR